MFERTNAYSGFAVDDLQKAREFYEDTLGLRVSAGVDLLMLHLAGGRDTLVYPKPDFAPATYTILNFPTTLGTNRTEDELASYGPQPSKAERAEALVGGFHVTWLASAILLAAGRLLLVLLVRRRDAEAVAHGEAAAVAV